MKVKRFPFVLLLLVVLLGTSTALAELSTEPPFEGEPVTEFQIQLADTLIQRQASGDPTPDVTFSTFSADAEPPGLLSAFETRTLEAETVTVVASTYLYFDGPEEAGYSEWPAVEISGSLAGDGNSFTTGDLTEEARQGVEEQIPGFWENAEFGQEAREYLVTETFEMSSGTEVPLLGINSFGSIPLVLPETLQAESDLPPSTGDILMGFTFTGPDLSYIIEQQVRPCVKIWPFGNICAELFYIKAGFELDWGLGLRLPANVTLGSGVNASFETSLEPQDWSVTDYITFGAAPEPNADDETDGNEFVMRVNFFVGILIRIVGIEVCPLPKCYVALEEDFSDSFMTPFGSGTTFPIDPVKIPLFEIDAGIGSLTINFEITPHLTSTQIIADWEATNAGETCATSGTVTYQEPGVTVGLDPTFDPEEDCGNPHQVTVKNFKYHFNEFGIGLGAGIDFSIVGYSGSYSKEIYTLNIGDIFGGLYLGNYSECNSIFNKDQKKWYFQCFDYINQITFPDPSTDLTPPAIIPKITGVKGVNGWYKSDVTLTWIVSDPQSDIISQTGCDQLSITSDQALTDYTCTAESSGGSSTATVSIKRDATAPTLECPVGGPFPRNSGDQAVGPADVNADISGLNEEASELAGVVPTTFPGTQNIKIHAKDLAGNYTSLNCTYEVVNQLQNVSLTPFIDENGVVTLSGEFTDPGTVDGLTLYVDWGDGPEPQLLPNYPAGTPSFSAVHTYLDDDPTATPNDMFDITITIQDEAGRLAVYRAYEFVSVSRLTWEEASTAAESIPDPICPGHLVAITSQKEQNRLYNLSLDEDGVSALQGKWFGGYQDEGQIDPADGWHWVTGEAWDYTNWAPGEPNDSGGEERYLIGWDSGWAWNDEANLGNVTGYVVEYDCLTVTVNNVVPVVDAGADVTIDEGTAYNLSATFSDVGTQDTHIVEIHWGDGSPVESNLTGSHLYADDGEYTVLVCVTDDDTGIGCDTVIVTVENVAPVVEASIPNQTVQYSDYITPVTFTATDIAADTMIAVTSTLPASLIFTENGCSITDNTNTCTWTLSGTMDVPVDVYGIEVTVSDEDGGSSTITHTITVTHEDADIWLDDDNQTAVEVAAPGGNSGAFSLTAYVKETYPDSASGAPDPGDINHAMVEITLAAVGPGTSYSSTCTPVGVTGTGYDAVLKVSCAFDDVEVNTYHVQASVVGDYYSGGPDENVLVIFDPSLGFTTGGGWFYWPGENEKTNFGYTMKYNKKGANVKGSLLIIRHTDSGNFRVKSNALDGLAIGAGDGFGWASFSGKSTYSEPGWPEPIGNYSFLVYVEDHGQGGDQFWIEVYDKDGELVIEMSLPREAVGNTEPLEGGNIVVPH